MGRRSRGMGRRSRGMGRRVMMGVHIHTCTNAMHPEVGRLVHGDTVEHMEEGVAYLMHQESQ